MGTFSTTALNAMLDTELTTVYAKLHTGDPGSAGTSNAANNTTRQQLTLAAASAGVKVQTVDLTWTSVPNAETYAWLSFWTAGSGGTFLGRTALAASQAVVVGNNFTVSQPNITFQAS